MSMKKTRSRFGALVAVLTVSALSIGATPAMAGPDEDLHSLEHQGATGAVHSPNGDFDHGCQRHRYRYDVDAHGGDWSLELFLVDSDREQVANGYEWKGRDPATGRGAFEFCSQATQPGAFTVRARLTWDDGEYHEKWLKPRKLRLR